ncbi:MAG TPA: phosphonopyruvate decarboxylase [Opitutaceae bacterium]|nr:phosphonopyruvate decarboxylase [Opitutaceae bacterium]
MLPANVFLDLCDARGVRFITGTPCSYLKPLINAAIDDARFVFRDATNEGDAVAMAAGATLAGQSAIVMFQNSGLGNAVNALTSLCYPFRVPMLVVVTHRAEPGGEPDEPQHEQMGRITTALLDTMEIPWEKFPNDAGSAEAVIERALERMKAESRPVALVMSKDAVAPHALKTKPSGAAIGARTISFSENLGRSFAERATRTEALKAIKEARRENEVLVATTGYTGRELYALGDDPWNFYMVGSMGSASAFGLGLALFAKRNAVTIIDGDGAALMRLGNLASIGAYGPKSLTHVVLDNEAHDSTGGQSTVSRGVAFAAVAQSCGYAKVVSTDDLGELAAALKNRNEDGPLFVHFRIKTGAPEKLPRPKTKPVEVFRRLGGWLSVSKP